MQPEVHYNYIMKENWSQSDCFLFFVLYVVKSDKNIMKNAETIK